jgi:hypothetical protein
VRKAKRSRVTAVSSGAPCFLPVGNQFVQGARIHDRAGEDVGADFGAFLDQADVDFGIDLLEADRGGKSGRAAADDDDIEFHGFALHADLDRYGLIARL